MKRYLAILLFLSLNLLAHAQLRLPKMVSDGMVLQRDQTINIWGWGTPGQTVNVSFKGKSYSTQVGSNEKWAIAMKASKAGGPYTMEIKSGEDKIQLSNLLIGDVWLCAGQSNMVHYFELHQDRYGEEIANANYSQIRQFAVPTNAQLQGPQEDLPSGSWKEANSENLGRFSIVAYFFGKELHEKYKIPIGLINASVGGTPIEAWISEEGFKNFPGQLAIIEQNKDTAYVNQKNRKARITSQAANAQQPGDDGLNATPKWYETSYEPKNWHNINIPGYWEDQGIRDLDGSVWYRREIEVPATMVDQPARIYMGRIIDADKVYINGKEVGGKTYQYPQRSYFFDAGVLKEGKNVITIRVTNYGGKGGFVPDKPYYLAAGGDTLDLKGTWQYKVSQVFKPVYGRAYGVSAQNSPTALFNGMVAPFLPQGIKGAIWYQGESNAGRPRAYEDLLKALIADWRNQWNDPKLPVLFAQLPNFMDVNYSPSESGWAALRESQRKVLSVPNTAMAVSLDAGEWNDIHPDHKQPIGERLALGARKIAYGDKKVVYSGPMIAGATVEGQKVRLQFDHVGSGIVYTDGEPLRWFSIAGTDQQYQWAQVKIEGNEVVIWNDEIVDPTYVRYAWMDNPADINFYNKEGLPASPFEWQLTDELWYGKKATVVLTYDDALDVHLDNAMPLLDSLGLKATFYLSGAASGSRINDWKSAARRGHELGNHTIYHPCDGEGRDWVTEANDLSQYSTEQIVREIDMMNIYLQALDGKRERTFAYTCGDTETKDGSFVPQIEDKFIALRGVHSELNHLDSLDMKNLNCVIADQKSADEMIEWAVKAKKENALLVVLFHGVGGGHASSATLEAHHQFVKYLKENEKDIWITTMIDAAKHINEKQAKK